MRFCVNVRTTSKPSVFARARSSAIDASNSTSLTSGNCTAATTAALRCFLDFVLHREWLT
jgi:hypothetical protein